MTQIGIEYKMTMLEMWNSSAKWMNAWSYATADAATTIIIELYGLRPKKKRTAGL